MSLLIDSFDHYTDLSQMYDGVMFATIEQGKGRYGTAGVSIPSSSGSITGYLYKTLTVAPYWSFGVAWTRNNLIFSGNFMNPVMGLIDSTSATRIMVYLNQDGTMKVVQGLASTVLATMTKPTRDSKFYYLELRAFIDSTAGWVELWANSSLRASAYNVNTDYSGSGGVNRIIMYSGGNPYFDDLSVKWGNTEQSRFGDCRMVCLYPASDGTYTQWTPSSGSAHYSLVNESVPDTTNYLASSGSPIDTFNLDTLGSALGNLNAIQGAAYSKLTSSGSRAISFQGYIGGNLYSMQTATVNSTSYAYQTMVTETNPATGNALSIVTLNASQFGIKPL